MFQLEWADKDICRGRIEVQARNTGIDRTNIKYIMHGMWEEHCVECATPECYTTCLLYEKRRDNACARFSYGIVPNKGFKGHFGFGADIEFKKWAKLEIDLGLAFPGPLLSHSLAAKYRLFPGRLKNWIREGLSGFYHPGKIDYDAFILECYSEAKEECKLFLEYFIYSGDVRKSKFRHVFHLRNGYNYFSIDFAEFHMDKLEGYVYLYPEKCEPVKRIIFTWIDFVKYRHRAIRVDDRIKAIKCLSWDLDNTLWKGVISEEEVTVDQRAIALIKELDQRGILQTIVSKNDFEPAWKKIKELELDEYFLCPAINWGQKSQNLLDIARKLNIGIDSFGVIDDSEFERQEIRHFLPEVRVYPEDMIDKLMTLAEFNAPGSEFGRSRRSSYQIEFERERERASFSGTYLEYLRNCKMVLDVFCPQEEADVLRAWELLSRGNQLNLSGNRYSQGEFRQLISAASFLPIALRCRDKFGDYGIIGYATMQIAPGGPILEDFVLSCRVAQKQIEKSFLAALANLLEGFGFTGMDFKFVKTPKNGPLEAAFREIPFEKSEADSGLRLVFSNWKLRDRSVVTVRLCDSIHTRLSGG
jgi:FkbH-like protein